jgi:hypothetical protein
MTLRSRVDRLQARATTSLRDLTDEELDAQIADLMPRALVDAPPHIQTIAARWPRRSRDVGSDDLTTMIDWVRWACGKSAGPYAREQGTLNP